MAGPEPDHPELEQAVEAMARELDLEVPELLEWALDLVRTAEVSALEECGWQKLGGSCDSSRMGVPIRWCHL